MSMPDEVLGVLSNASGAMRTSEIRDALDLEGTEGTTKVSSALNSLVGRGAVERIQGEGGYTYLAVPGWTPAKRGGGVPAVKGDTREARTAKRKAKPDKAKKPGAVQTTVHVGVSTKEQAESIARAVQEGPRIRHLLQGVDAMPQARAPAELQADGVTLSRETVRTLVAGVLMFGGDLGEALRRAVIEATGAAA